MFRTYEQTNLVSQQQIFKKVFNFEEQPYYNESDNPAYLPIKSHNYNQLFLCYSRNKELNYKVYHLDETVINPINNVTLSTCGSIIEGYLSDDNKLLALTYSDERTQHGVFKKASKVKILRTLVYNVYSSRHITIENAGYQYFHFLSNDVYYLFNERKGVQLMRIKNNLETKAISCSCKLYSGIYKCILGFGNFIVHIIVQQKVNRPIALVELLRYKDGDLVYECVLSTNRFDFDTSTIHYEFKASYYPLLIVKQERFVQIFNFCRKESLFLTLYVYQDFIQTARFNNFDYILAHQERQYYALEFDGLLMLVRPCYTSNQLFVVVISANPLQRTKVQYSVITPLLSYDQQEFVNYCKVLHYCLQSEEEDARRAMNACNRFVEDFYQGKQYKPLSSNCSNVFNNLPYELYTFISGGENVRNYCIRRAPRTSSDISELMAFFQHKMVVFYEQSDCISAASYSECTCQFMEASSSVFTKMIYFQFKPEPLTSTNTESKYSCTTENSDGMLRGACDDVERVPTASDMSTLLYPEIIDVKFQKYNEEFQAYVARIPVPDLPWVQISTSRFRLFQIPFRHEKCSDLLLFDVFHQAINKVEAIIQIEDYGTFQNIFTVATNANYRVRLDCLYHTLRRNLITEACLYSGLISSRRNVTGMTNLWLERLGHILSTGFVDTNMMSVIILSRCFYSTKLLLTQSTIPYCENILLAIINQLLRNTSSDRDLYKLYTRFEDVPTDAVFSHRRQQSENSENLFKIMNSASSQPEQYPNISELSSQSNLMSTSVFLADNDGQTLQCFDHPYFQESQLTQSFLLLKQFEQIQSKTIENRYKRKNLNNYLILSILYNQLLTEELNYITIFQNLLYVFPVMERASIFDDRLKDSEHNLWAQIYYVITSIYDALERFGVHYDYQYAYYQLYYILYATIQGTVEVIIDRLKDSRTNSLRKHEIIISIVEVLEILQVQLPAKLIQAIWYYMAFAGQDIRDYLNSMV